jgi:Ca2+:H+ antiporter
MIAGGMKFHEQSFRSTVASTTSSLNGAGAAFFILLYTFHATGVEGSAAATEAGVILLSRAVAIASLIIGVLYYTFRIRTHADLYDLEDIDVDEDTLQQDFAPMASAIFATFYLTSVAVTADTLFMGLKQCSFQLREVAALFIIPGATKICQHANTAVRAYSNKMDQVIDWTGASSLNMSLCLIPFWTILAWIIGEPMTLETDFLKTSLYGLSVWIMVLIVQDGKSNFLEGIVLVSVYILSAFALILWLK